MAHIDYITGNRKQLIELKEFNENNWKEIISIFEISKKKINKLGASK